MKQLQIRSAAAKYFTDSDFSLRICDKAHIISYYLFNYTKKILIRKMNSLSYIVPESVLLNSVSVPIRLKHLIDLLGK